MSFDGSTTTSWSSRCARHAEPPSSSASSRATADGQPLDFALCLARRPALVRFADRLTGGAQVAEDLVQDTLLRAHRFWARFVPREGITVEEAVAAWLYQITYNLFVNHYHAQVRERAVMARSRHDVMNGVYGTAEDGHEPDPTAGALSDEIRAALAQIAPKWREILEKVYLDGRPYRDAADELGIPIGTVMSALHRARNQLIARLSPFAAAAYGIRAVGRKP